MKKRIYCICIQASSKTEEDRKSLRVFSPSLMKVSHAVFVGFLSLLLHSLPTPTSPYPLLLPSSLFPKSNSKRQLEKEGKEIFIDHRLTSENGVYLESSLPFPWSSTFLFFLANHNLKYCQNENTYSCYATIPL